MTTDERRELRDDLKTEIEEIDADLIGYRYDLNLARTQINEARAKKAELIAQRNELKTVKA
jgi:hypothetical protein